MSTPRRRSSRPSPAAARRSCSRATSRRSTSRTTVVVHANVAPATHGETVQQLLGSGRAAAAVPALHARPSAAHATSSRGRRPARRRTLEVRVNDVLWHEVATPVRRRSARPRLRDPRRRGGQDVRPVRRRRARRAPADRAEQRPRDYRKGIGPAGIVKRGQLSQLLDRPLGREGRQQPARRERRRRPGARRRRAPSIPLGVRTLGRVVSLRDYEDFARAFAGIAKAHAPCWRCAAAGRSS